MKLPLTFALLALTATATLFVARADDAKKPKPAANQNITKIKSADLNGKTVTLPDDFSAPRTLLLVAFQRDHQGIIDGWVEGLKLKPTDKDWFELPVVGAMNPIGQKFLDGAMRSGIAGDDKRSRVVTLYTDAKKWIAPLGKTKTDTIYVVVVAKNGEILGVQDGTFDKKKADAINKIWRAKK